ncbi:MAG: hypothetical protein U0230_03025 [Polyangiales bacterium]
MHRRLALPFLLVLLAGCDSDPVKSNFTGGPDGGALSTPIPGCMPEVLPSTGSLHQDCVDRINQFRVYCQNLPPLARWTSGESCADDMAAYDSQPGRGAHAAFRADLCDGGFAQNECPGWPSTAAVVSGCLQSMWDEGPGTPYSAHGHYINMSNTEYTEVACGFHTTADGKVWGLMNFR